MVCAGCGHPNRERACFCQKCGDLLGLCCPRCSADHPPGVHFCDSCGLRLADAPPAAADPEPRAHTPNHLPDEILSSQNAIKGERKRVTVLFLDIWGSMELAESVDSE